MRHFFALRTTRWLVIAVGWANLCYTYAQDSTFISENYEKREYLVPMRDGIRLFTSVYIPRDSTSTFPILLNRTPYGVHPYGARAYRKWMVPSMLFAHEGYIFAYQDVRGKYMSEGEYINVRPHKPSKDSPDETDESSDTYDTIEWLIRNVPGNNARVGLTGISYPGFYTSMGLIDAHPCLVAASPQAPIADWFIGDDDHHNGALFLAETFDFFSSFGHPRPHPTTKRNWRFGVQGDDIYKFFLELGPLSNVNARYFRDSIAYWNDLVSHADYDTFWQRRNVLPHLRNIAPAVMVVGGWFDKEDLYGTLSTYKEIEQHNPGIVNILVMGPWAHGGWGRSDGEQLGEITFGSATAAWYREQIEFPFFNFFLKGKGEPALAEATVFETGANQWRRLSIWPPRDTVRTRLYLHAGGHLDSSPPGITTPTHTSFVSDPALPVPHSGTPSRSVRPEYMIEDQRFASARPDVLTFVTAPLGTATTVAGPVEVECYVSTTGTDADWVVKLIDVFPEDSSGTTTSGQPWAGFQMLVRGDVMRGKYRNSFVTPEPFTPGKPTQVRFRLPDVFHQFRPRHRIMIQVQSSWFPLVDRNPQTFVNIYRARAEDFTSSEQTVFHAPGAASAVILPLWHGDLEKDPAK